MGALRPPLSLSRGMVVTTETDIANTALSRVGHNRMMTSYDDDATTEGNIVRLHYPRLRDALLRAHPWNFAIKRAALAPEGTAPTYEYGYKFPLPNDCLKVIRTRIESENTEDDYRIEGRYVLSNEATCSIEYIARVTDPAQFDAMFVDVLAWSLAAEIAMPLINDARAAENAARMFERKLVDARSIDGQEGTPRQPVAAYSWLTARLG